MSVITEQLGKVLVHAKERGLKEALNYGLFRYSYAIHGPFVASVINRLAPYPTCVEIEVTTKCNLRCTMCEHTYWNEPNVDMTYNQFLHIMKQFPRLRWIGLTGIGESLMNKDFMKMVEYVKERKIYLELFDTFYFWDKVFSRKMVSLGLNRVVPSLDGATAATYESIRVNSKFDRVVQNLRDLFAVKRELKRKLPEVHFHFIVSKKNIDEMLPYLDLTKDIAQGEPISVQFTELLHGYEQIADQVVRIPDSLVSDVEKRACALGTKLNWNRNVNRVKPVFSRCTLWTMPFIFVSGHVIPCCGGNEANARQAQKDTSMGNIFEQDFKTIWNGAKYRALRKELGHGRVPSPCRNCPVFANS
jgi:MoaA/NifB/PqqE/SkfB family radical SAM enzyme